MKNKIEWWKVRHFFRDLFMPRYALIVSLVPMPDPINPFGGGMIHVPAVPRLPYKRPFFMPFNQFYNGLNDRFGVQAMVFCGSKKTLSRLYGIGSALPHNLKNAIQYTEEDKLVTLLKMATKNEC